MRGSMKIVVFLPGWVGDAVMATPAVRALREHFRDAEMIGVLKPYVAGVFEGAPWFDRLQHLERTLYGDCSWLDVVRRLHGESPDLAVLFPNSFRHALIAWLAGCRRRIGYDRYGRGPLLTDRLSPLRDRNGTLTPCPILDDYNRLAGAVGCPILSRRLELFTTPRDEAAAQAVWHESGLSDCAEVICLNPGAAFGAAKHWPAEHFAALGRMLVDQRGSGLLVLCGPGERELARQIVLQINRPRVTSLADQPLSLGLTKACVRRGDLLVTTDSGPRHFAAAFDRPVVTLFGPTHIAWTETYHPRAVHLQKKVSCGPCQKRVCPLDHRCMKELTPADVLAAVSRLVPAQDIRSVAG
jgi:heptosyltransferase-2